MEVGAKRRDGPVARWSNMNVDKGVRNDSV